MCRESLENFEENHQTIKKMRSEEKFELCWKDVQTKAANLRIDPPKLPRKGRAPYRIEECLRKNAAPQFDEDTVSYYRKIYNEVLDCITNNITDHFDQQEFKTYIKLENLLTKKAKGDDFHAEYDDVLSIYRKDLMTINFNYSWKHFQNIAKSLTS